MIKPENLYCADVETDNHPKYPSVVSWGVYSIYGYVYGISIESFFAWLKTLDKDSYIFFHNFSGFDGSFIIPQMQKQGYKPKFTKSKKERVVYKSSEYKTLHTEKGALKENEYTYIPNKSFKLYELKIGIKATKKSKYGTLNKTITFRDSKLLFLDSLAGYGETLNKAYNTDKYTKLKEDYNNLHHYDSVEEFEQDTKSFKYLKQDCFILHSFLMYMNNFLPFSKWKMTQAATAYEEWKKMFAMKIIKESGEWGIIPKTDKFEMYYQKLKPNKHYKLTAAANMILKKWFPVNWQDNFNTKSWYFGGLTHLNNDYKGIILDEDLSISNWDVISSYPYSLVNSSMPFGAPYVPGTVNNKEEWHLYEVRAITDLVNEFGLPFIPRQTGEAYIYDRVIEKNRKFNLNSADIETFKKYYKGKYKIKKVLSFQARKGEFFFGDYVNHFYTNKINAKKEGNDGLEFISKIFLNALYGKFGSNTLIGSKILNHDSGQLEEEEVLMMANFYMPISINTTSNSRMLLVEAVGMNYKHFVYCDTDSIYVIHKHLHKFTMNTQENTLGAFELETRNLTGVFRRPKQYAIWGKVEGKNIVKMHFSGILPPEEYQFNEMDYISGTVMWDQIRPVSKKITVNYGTTLEDTEKYIRPIWEYETEHTDWFYVERGKLKPNQYIEAQRDKYLDNYHKQVKLLSSRM